MLYYVIYQSHKPRGENIEINRENLWNIQLQRNKAHYAACKENK